MKFGFKFSNLCGTVYKKGKVIFTPSGDAVLSPVGNRVSMFDLVNSKSITFAFETRKDVSHLAISPDGVLLIVSDEEGRALLVNLPRKVVIHRFNFRAKVNDLKFSPDGRFFAVTHGKQVHVWRAPGKEKRFAPLSLHKRFPSFYDDVTCLDWSHDSRFIAAGCKDTTCRVFAVNRIPGYRTVTLTSHRTRVIMCSFVSNSLDLYTLAHDGMLIKWRSIVTPASEAEIQERETKRRKPATGQSKPDKHSQESSDSDSHSEEEGSDSDEEVEKEADGADGAGSDSQESADEDESEHGSSDGDDDDDDDEAESDSASDSVEPELHFLYKWTTGLGERHHFKQDRAKVMSAVHHKPSNIVVVGFSNGVFALYEMPDGGLIHSLSISQKRITSVAVNSTGDWLAFGCAKLGQLLVWEWQSESYILKQQGHFYDMNVLSHSPDGQHIVTGGDDGKVKIWSTATGFCNVTFTEHRGAITGSAFVPSGMAVVTSSLDGTVRAFDLMRYRNFRTMTSPQPVQFSCLALDPSGELVCAGCQDTFEIYVWSLQTGKLLDIMAGHEAPVSRVWFHPMHSVLLSASWDSTVKIWDVFETKGARETVDLGCDVLDVSFRSDGQQFAAASLNGHISFFGYPSPQPQGTIEGRRDLIAGRRVTDKFSSKHAQTAKYFSSLCYTADGSCIIAAGQSKYVCIYECKQLLLLKRFCLSNNLSLDGMQHRLNSKFDTEAGPLALVEDNDSDSDLEERVNFHLPGVAKGDMSSRRTQPEMRVKSVQFSPTGRAWAAATTEGLMIFSLDETIVFDPFDLSLDITPDNIRKVVKANQLLKALIMAFRLNENDIIREVLEQIHFKDVDVLAKNTPTNYVERFLRFLAAELQDTRHLEFYLRWINALFNFHGKFIRAESSKMMTCLHAIQKSLLRQQKHLETLCTENTNTLQYLIHLSNTMAREGEAASVEVDDDALVMNTAA